MATYKVIQDIEAEDKLLGPLSLRQFIYAAIVVVSGFIAFKIALVAWWAAIFFLPHMILFGILAAPFGHDQSSEVWLLAKIRFALKPQRRIWDQSGLKELVTITVPKRIERQLTNGLSQTEVKSRLEALANTIDSRGWAVKNVNVNLFSQPSYVAAYGGVSDRLIDPNLIPQEVPSYNTTALTDVMDMQSSPTAQHFETLIANNEQARRQQLTATMQHATQSPTTATPPPNYWFMNQTPQATAPGQAAFAPAPVVAPGSASTTDAISIDPATEAALLDKIHKDHDKPNPTKSHLKTIKPLAEQREDARKAAAKKAQEAAAAVPPAPVTPAPNPAILQLANNDDLNVATLARQANKALHQEPDGEVVISLR